MSITVAVRVRPFNSREKELNSQLCIEMNGNTTTLLDLEQKDSKEQKRVFSFDYSFWSHDSYNVDEKGYLVPENDTYADQQAVFDQCGVGLLNNAWEGYHCTLFAYGQTGSGKSWSVMGYKPNVGIVPIMCQEIFKRIQEDTENKYEVVIGMLEIYNEKVQDLFQDVDDRPAQGLRIRQSKSIGFYSEGQKKYPVRNFAEIEKRIENGSKNRTVAATQMNATSSRAHTIITIELKQKIQQPGGGKPLEKLSIINLVDLAGSEKVNKTGASGQRLKEASCINQSLSTLGLTISILADRQLGKTNRRVPYRDSVLTKLLKNALGGNSKTIMICAISPAFDNYEESLSTLRYADQAKKIKNKAIVNESPTDKLIRELRLENEKLLKQVQQFQAQIDKADMSDPQQINKKNYLEELQENINQNQKMMEEQEKSEEQKLQELETQDKKIEEKELQNKIDESKDIHLSNLNEDPQLDHMIKYSLEKSETKVGRKPKSSEDQSQIPDIVLNGLGIKQNHCQFLNESENQIFIQASQDDYLILENIYINGQKLNGLEKYKLFHNDRIIIGQNTTFLIKIPLNTELREGTPENQNIIDKEFAQEELNKQTLMQQKIAEEQMQKTFNDTMQQKIDAMQEKHQKELQKQYQEMQKQEEELKQKIQQLEQENKKEENDSQLLQLKNSLKQSQLKISEVQDKEKQKLTAQKLIMKIQQSKNKKQLEQDLAQINPKINEMNFMAEELDRKIKFMLQTNNNDGQNVKVHVENEENNTSYTWNLDKAQDRYFVMLDIFEKYQQTDIKPILEQDQDPFYDIPDPITIGISELKVDSLCYQQPIKQKMLLYKEEDRTLQGLFDIEIYQTQDQETFDMVEKEENQIYNMDPDNLLEKPFTFCIIITNLIIPKNIADIQLQYQLFDKIFKTDNINDIASDDENSQDSSSSSDSEDSELKQKRKLIEGNKNMKHKIKRQFTIHNMDLKEIANKQKQFNYSKIHKINEFDEYHLHQFLTKGIKFFIKGQILGQEISQETGQIVSSQDLNKLIIKHQEQNNQKEKELEKLQNQNSVILIKKDENQKPKNQKVKNENEKQKYQQQPQFSDSTASLNDYNEKQKKNNQRNTIITIIIGVLCIILYLTQLIISIKYGKEYQTLEKNQYSQNSQQIIQNKDSDEYYKDYDEKDDLLQENNLYWDSFNLILTTDIILLITMIFPVFLVIKPGDFLKYYIIALWVPFIIFFICSIVWLESNQKFHNLQSNLSSKQDNDYCSKDFKKNYKRAEYQCDLSDTYESLHFIAIFNLIFQSIFFNLFQMLQLIMIKRYQQQQITVLPISQQNLEIQENNNNNNKNSQTQKETINENIQSNYNINSNLNNKSLSQSQYQQQAFEQQKSNQTLNNNSKKNITDINQKQVNNDDKSQEIINNSNIVQELNQKISNDDIQVGENQNCSNVLQTQEEDNTQRSLLASNTDQYKKQQFQDDAINNNNSENNTDK